MTYMHKWDMWGIFGEKEYRHPSASAGDFIPRLIPRRRLKWTSMTRAVDFQSTADGRWGEDGSSNFSKSIISAKRVAPLFPSLRAKRLP